MSGYSICGMWIDEVWSDRESSNDAVEFEPRLIGRLSAPLSAVRRGASTTHAAPLMRSRMFFGDFVYPRLTSLCGVKGWGEAFGPVTCRRCLRIMEAK